MKSNCINSRSCVLWNRNYFTTRKEFELLIKTSLLTRPHLVINSFNFEKVNLNYYLESNRFFSKKKGPPKRTVEVQNILIFCFMFLIYATDSVNLLWSVRSLSWCPKYQARKNCLKNIITFCVKLYFLKYDNFFETDYDDRKFYDTFIKCIMNYLLNRF